MRLFRVGLGLTLVGLVSACGGSSAKLYDAQATYACLRKLPEYRSPSSIRKVVRELESGIALMPGIPHRLESIAWGENVIREPFWLISIVVVPGLPNTPDIQIYDDLSAVAKTFEFARRANPGDSVMRNVLIDAIDSAPKKARSLIVGCLRTR